LVAENEKKNECNRMESVLTSTLMSTFKGGFRSVHGETYKHLCYAAITDNQKGGLPAKYVELVQSMYDGRRMPPEVRPDVRVIFPIFGANPSIDTAATVGTADTNNNNKRSSSIAPIVVDIASPCQRVSRKI
jgi:hypothetical protein